MVFDVDFSWKQRRLRSNTILAHFSFESAMNPSASARYNAFVQDFLEDQFMERFPVLRGKWP